MLIVGALVAFGVYKYQAGTANRPAGNTTTPAPAEAPSAAPSGNTSGGGFGTRLEFNGGEVFRTASVTEAEATRVGKYLVDKNFFDGAKKSVQLNKSGGTYEFRMVVDQDVADNYSRDSMFKAFAAQLSTGVFHGSPVALHLCDSQFKTLRVISMDSSAAAQGTQKLASGDLKTFVNTKENVHPDLAARFVSAPLPLVIQDREASQPGLRRTMSIHTCRKPSRDLRGHLV